MTVSPVERQRGHYFNFSAVEGHKLQSGTHAWMIPAGREVETICEHAR